MRKGTGGPSGHVAGAGRSNSGRSLRKKGTTCRTPSEPSPDLANASRPRPLYFFPGLFHVRPRRPWVASDQSGTGTALPRPSRSRRSAPRPPTVSSESLPWGAGTNDSLLDSFHFQLPFSTCSGVNIRKVPREGSGKMKRRMMPRERKQKGSPGQPRAASPLSLLPTARLQAKARAQPAAE